MAADDTDIVVMLCFHYNTSLNNIFFCTERSEIQKVRAHKGRKYWRINQIADALQVSNHILFCHAWSGCDTTSAMYQQGKLKILELLNSKDVQSQADYFGKLESTQTVIGEAGSKLAIKCYGGRNTDTLGRLRHAKYMHMIVSSSSLQPERLPPTSRTIYYHALRVHFQVCQWKYLNLNILDVRECGWVKRDNVLEPILTDMEISSKNPCGKQPNCSCRKNGISCATACGDGRGVQCSNPAVMLDDELGNEQDEFLEKRV